MPFLSHVGGEGTRCAERTLSSGSFKLVRIGPSLSPGGDVSYRLHNPSGSGPSQDDPKPPFQTGRRLPLTLVALGVWGQSVTGEVPLLPECRATHHLMGLTDPLYPHNKWVRTNGVHGTGFYRPQDTERHA